MRASRFYLTALACCIGIVLLDSFPLQSETVSNGFSNAFATGRLQKVRSNPAHRLSGKREKAQYLPPERLRVLIATSARFAGFSPDLLRTVLMAESAGQVNAISKAGAKGLMQLGPGTVSMYGNGDPFEVHRNVTIGANYLALLLARYHGNKTFALAAYNAGPLVVSRYGGVPPYPETIAYLNEILGRSDRAKPEIHGKTKSLRLHDGNAARLKDSRSRLKQRGAVVDVIDPVHNYRGFNRQIDAAQRPFIISIPKVVSSRSRRGIHSPTTQKSAPPVEILIP